MTVLIQLLQVQLGRAEPLLVNGKPGLSAIRKLPVEGPVAVGTLGLQGDEQADLSVHGGRSKAVYAYPSEHLPFWQTVRAQAGLAAWDEAVPAALLGPNLLLKGVLEKDLWIGDRLEFPGCTLLVSEPRRPCAKFNASMGFKHAARLMEQSGFCGTYLAVGRPGTLQAGQAATLVPGPREVGVLELFKSHLAPWRR